MTDMAPRSNQRLGRWLSVRRFVRPLSAVGVAAAYAAGAFLLSPGHELPGWLQRLVGLGFAAVAVGAFWAATRRRESPAALILRAKLAQQSDFGKQLHPLPSPRFRRLRLPFVGSIRARTLAAAAIFAASVFWWWSPWAPVRVKKLVLEDLTIPLGEEIAIPALVLPNGRIALLQTPLFPSRVREIAAWIPDNADACQLAVRELARGRLDDARLILNRAGKRPARTPAASP